ncbi:MAG: hypothetical protein MR024_02165 [Firmicutes bacterium]|nr:hypothetical protein [Bacillota bacterium]
MAINSFEIPQKKLDSGKYSLVGAQQVNFSEFENIINFGKNLTDDKTPICSIINQNGQMYLMVNKNTESLKDLQIFSDGGNENYDVYKIKNTTMYANEDISFQLENSDAKSFGNLTIKSNGIVHEKNGVQTTLLALEDKFIDVDLPKNIVELTKNENAPIKLRESKKAKRCALPAQMFENLKTLEENGTPNIKVKEWANIGKKGQSLRIALYGDRILVGDGVELKEVYAGLKIVPDMDESGKTGKKDIIVRFDKSTEKVGESKNSKLLDGVSPEIVNEIVEFLPEKYLSGEKVVDETNENIESLQVESIKSLTNPGVKFGISTLESNIEKEDLTMGIASNFDDNVDNDIVINDSAETLADTQPEQVEAEGQQPVEEQAQEQAQTEQKAEENTQQGNNNNNNNKQDKQEEKKGKSNKNKPLWQILISGFTALAALALCLASFLAPGIPLIVSILSGLLFFAVGIPTMASAKDYIAASMKNRKNAKKNKSAEQSEEKVEEKSKKQNKSKKQTKEKKTVTEKAPKQEKVDKAAKKAEAEKAKNQEIMVNNFNTLINNTDKTIEIMEDYNKFWGKGAKTVEKQELLKNSQECVEELKEFKQFATSQELNEESMKEICLRKQNIKNKYFDTIKSIKQTLGKSNTLEP